MNDTWVKRADLLVSEIEHEAAQTEFMVWEFGQYLRDNDTRDIVRLPMADAPHELGKADMLRKFYESRSQYDETGNLVAEDCETPASGFYAEEADIPGEPVIDDGKNISDFLNYVLNPWHERTDEDIVLNAELPDETDPGQSWWDTNREATDPDA